jgi:hypothetical protein
MLHVNNGDNITIQPASWDHLDQTTVLVTITHADGTTTVQSLLNQNPVVATHLVVQAPATAQPGQAVLVTVAALTAQGQPATGYRGTVTFTSSDAAAGLPGAYTFTPADAGLHTFVAVLHSPGTWSLTVQDVAAPSLANAVAVTVPSSVASFPAGTDLTTQVKLVSGRFRHRGRRWQQVVTLTNLSSQALVGPLQLVLGSLPRRVRLNLPSGFTSDHSSYVNLDLGPEGRLNPGQTVTVALGFRSSSRPACTLRVLAG